MRKSLFVIFIILALSGLSFRTGLADGIIIPDPPICDPCPVPSPMVQLSIRYHHVTVSIKDQLAITRVDQVFFNPNDWEVEGDYVFPIPKGAAVSNFTLWIDGQPVEGEILDAETARQTFEQIVSTMRDPALLEYADQDTVRARIYPIPPHVERRIEIQYSQVLTSDNGLVQYLYPLGTEKFSREPLESVSVTVDIESASPIRAVYSPSHEISLFRESDYKVAAGYEEQDILPDQDFSLIYSLGESEAFHLLTYREEFDRIDSDGFFLLLLAPSLQGANRPIPKDVIIVMDQSGSMEGEKFEQAQAAVSFVLHHLNQGDRFNIIAFSTGVDLFSRGLSSTTEINQALTWVDLLRAAGSTDINRALLDAVSFVEPERSTYVIFLTDGLPTVGEVDSVKIVENLRRQAPENLRLFVFGVGYDVDTYLLDSLAQEQHGISSYVVPGENLDEVISSFYNKVSSPVMTNLKLDFGDLLTKEIYPNPLPDLYQGSQIAVVGRYIDGGMEDVFLRGSVDGVPQELIYPDQIFILGSAKGDGPEASIPGLWATRKIGYLLAQIRLNGPDDEIIEEIVELSIRYGIVTPYTSYLVTEPSMLGIEEQERIVSEEIQRFNDLAGMPTFGESAVEQAAGQNSMANAEAAPGKPKEASGKVRKIGSWTFVNSDGIWTDTRFDPSSMKTTKIEFLSEEYTSLHRKNPQLAKVFALGPQVIVIFGDAVYEITNSGSIEAENPISTQEDIQTFATDEIPQPTEMVTDQSSPSTSTLMPCWGGLIITMLPMLAIGYLRIRNAKERRN